MQHLDISQFLFMLLVILVAAKGGGELAQRFGQPPVLGELFAGMVVGTGVLGWVHPETETIHLLGELGVLVLLFEIGLHTDLKEMMRVGLDAMRVAVVGVAVPFAVGYGFALLAGWQPLTALFLGATLTATSVGITARVMADLRKLETREARIVLGAAVVDDVLGLLILAVVSAVAQRGGVSLGSVMWLSGKAVGFLAVAAVVGHLTAAPFIRLLERMNVAGALSVGILAFAVLFGWLAHLVGLAPIVGAFVAGIMLGQVHPRPTYEEHLVPLYHVLTPIFFIAVGAAVHPGVLNPIPPENRPVVWITGMLFVIAVVGKVVAGWAVRQKGVDRLVVGVGMVPRGEVGLIFANLGKQMGVIQGEVFSAIVVMLALTTFVAPPALRGLLEARGRGLSPTAEQVEEEEVTAAPPAPAETMERGQ